jgi:uncharacterized membrane protein YphA (DoxX/SURF4 family)
VTLFRRVVLGRGFAPMPLRVIMGLAFIVHGYPKITQLSLTAQNFDQQGFVPGLFWASLVAIVECVGGPVWFSGSSPGCGAAPSPSRWW